MRRRDTDEQALAHGIMADIDFIKAKIATTRQMDTEFMSSLTSFAGALDDAVHDYLVDAVHRADEKARDHEREERESAAEFRAAMAQAPAGYGR